jgi:hypothetical protein
MSENEGGESKSLGMFLLGFLTGVLVCLGAGGTFALVQGQRMAMQARDAEMMAREAAEMARMEHERARAAEVQARAEKDRAEKLLHETRKGAEKEKDKKDR